MEVVVGGLDLSERIFLTTLLRGIFPPVCRFGDATQVAYSFWLYDLCDTYLELIKPVVGDTSEGNKKVIHHAACFFFFAVVLSACCVL